MSTMTHNILQPADANSPRLNPFKNHSRDPSRPASPASSVAATCASGYITTPTTGGDSTDMATSASTSAPTTGGSAQSQSQSRSTHASPSKRPPKLSDLVAKYKKDARPSSSSSEMEGSVSGLAEGEQHTPLSADSISPCSLPPISDTPTRGRLGLAGRLGKSRSNSISSDMAANTENEDPRPADSADSGRSSPTKQAGRKKPPSLQEITERLHKKSLASNSSVASHSSHVSVDERQEDDQAAKATQDATASKDDTKATATDATAIVAQGGAASKQSEEVVTAQATDATAQATPAQPSLSEQEKASQAWDIPAAGPSRPVPARGAFDSLSPRRTSPVLSSSAAMAMPPPASTRPLSTTRGILAGRNVPMAPATAINIASSPPKPHASSHAPAHPAPHPPSHQLATSPEKRGPPLTSEVAHPLQHKWSLFFDSKVWKASPPGQDDSESPGPDPGTPWLAHAEVGPATPATPATPRSPRMGRSGGGGPASSENWEATLKMIGAYRTVESFMAVFKTIKRPSQLDKSANYHLFKDNIKPMWEDPANANGGKWVISFSQATTHPALLDRSWLWLVLGLVGEDLDDDDDVTGAVVSARPKMDRIALWVRDKSDVDKVNAIGRRFVEKLELEGEPGVSGEFAVNNAHGGFSHRRDGASRQYWSFHNPARPRGENNAASGPANSGADNHRQQGPVAPPPPSTSPPTGRSGFGGGRGSFSGPSGGQGGAKGSGGLGLGGPIGRHHGGGGGGGGGGGMGLFGRTGGVAAGASSTGSSSGAGGAWRRG